MSDAVSEWVNLTPVLAKFRAAEMVRSFGYSKRWCRFFPAAAAMLVAGIASVAVAVVADNPVVVRAMEDVVALKAEATPMTPILITRAPESCSCSP